jgi:hypothetical protein
VLFRSVGFERGAKKADFRGSSTFSFSPVGGNIYSASIPDVLTGERPDAYGMTYEGHPLFGETLNFEGARGVWRVTGSASSESVETLTRVSHFANLTHGKWYWNAGTMYICWVGEFVPSQFEIVQKAKAFELWQDSLPADGYRPGIHGIKSRFGLFGHHNGNCKGWRMVDSELCHNALDGAAIIAENSLAKSHEIFTHIYRCHIHNNGRHGITNFSTPAGAANRGATGWYDACLDFNYVHDNAGAGIFLHRTWRMTIDDDLPSIDYPLRVNNNTICNNGRGVVITDENMAETIDTFGYDLLTADDWDSMTYAQRVAYWDSLNPGYDTLFIKLRNNNIFNNGIDTELITGTWPGTSFVIDSDYNNIFPGVAAWQEGENSISVDPQITDAPKISGASGLSGQGCAPHTYPKNRETSSFYFTGGSDPDEFDPIGTSYNIGAASSGPAYADLVIARHLIGSLIETKSFNVPEGSGYICAVSVGSSIKSAIPDVWPENIVVAERTITISTATYDVVPAVFFDADNNGIYVSSLGEWRPCISVHVLANGAWRDGLGPNVVADNAWH